LVFAQSFNKAEYKFWKNENQITSLGGVMIELGLKLEELKAPKNSGNGEDW